MSVSFTPDIQPDTAPYLEAAADGRLLINRCGACSEAFFFPRGFCPFCSSDQVEWIEASGEGRIYSYTITYQKGQAVSAPALVTLAEGPTVLSAIVDQPFGDIRIDQSVRASFRPLRPGEAPVLVFGPA